MRLFCFPHAGGSAAAFAGWQAALPPGLGVHPVELPGRGRRMRAAPLRRMAPLVDDALEVMAPALAEPFALYGHSMGGLIAFETARALRRRGGPAPAHVVVAAVAAPALHVQAARYHTLPDPEFAAAIRGFGGPRPDALADPDLAEVFLPLLRADFELIETWAPRSEPPLACALTVFGGSRDRFVRAAALAAWREETEGPFALRMLDGDHFFPATAQPAFITELAAALAPGGARSFTSDGAAYGRTPTTTHLRC